jgi:hypothetical protein
MDHAWTLMLFECVQAGYWICETDHASKQFKYFVPNQQGKGSGLVKALLATGQQVIVCVIALAPQACLVLITADVYEGESNTAVVQMERMSRGRQRDLIGWLVSKLSNKFGITHRSAAPGTPLNIEDVTSPPELPTAQRVAPAASSRESTGKTSFDFLSE